MGRKPRHQKYDRKYRFLWNFTKWRFENTNLHYFWRWIQWNALENSIPNISGRILEIHHFRPHSGTLNRVSGHQAWRYSSGIFVFEFFMLQSILQHVDIFNWGQFWRILSKITKIVCKFISYTYKLLIESSFRIAKNIRNPWGNYQTLII